MKLMKVFAAAMLFCFATTAQAQLTKEQKKEREELRKQTKEELNKKASKDARKEAKRLAKEGWAPAPGALPLEKQLDRAYLMTSEYDSDMMPVYLTGNAQSTAENYDAAKMQAVELAKQELAGQLSQEITALIETNVANSQLGADDAASVTKSVMAAKSLVSQSMGRTIPMVEAYRTLPNKNKEVMIRIGYSMKQAKSALKQAMRQQLEQEGNELQSKLDTILGW